MKSFAAVLLLAALANAEDPAPPKFDPAAEDLVKKLEAKIASAKTVSMAWTMDLDSAAEKRKFAIKLLFREGNRVALHVDDADPAAKGAYSLSAVCDGKRVSRGDPDGTAVEDAPADLASRGRELAVRAPLRELTMTLGGGPSKFTCKYTGFTFLEDAKIGDRAVKVVAYASSHGKNEFQMKLWIDAEKLELLKRETVESRKGVETARVTDTFTAMTCDGEVADDVFAVPEAKGGDKKEEK